MKVINAHVLIPDFDGNRMLKKLERYGRVCYKSEGKFDPTDNNSNFLKMLVSKNHESVLEHEKLTMMFVVDRGVSHELVRHRIASYSQESTRYCNYSKDAFSNEITLIKPCFYEEKRLNMWTKAMEEIESTYFSLLEDGSTPQEARSVLPNSLKTEIVVTMNIRSLRNFLGLRCSPSAHPQIKEVAIPLLFFLQEKLSPLFWDIEFDKDFGKNFQGYVKVTNDYFEEI